VAEREVRFVVDAMLGNLVSWLRILGYDSLYWNGDDAGLLEVAERDGRIILTMDRGLASNALKNGVETLLLSENNTPQALAELSRRYGINLSFDPAQTRCPHCNHLLEIVKREPREEWTCPGCGKRYWVGGHWRNIKRVLEEARMRVADAQPE